MQDNLIVPALSISKIIEFENSKIQKCLKDLECNLSVVIWCRFSTGLIQRFFFENESGYIVSVEGDRYSGMISNLFGHEINDMDVENI